MTFARHLKRASLALIGLSSIGVLQSASAAGTIAGTTISNQATVSYQVGGVAQNPIASPTVQFVADNRIDLTVAEGSTTTTQTSPGLTNQVTSFTVTNTGNAAQAFVLSAANMATGTASPFTGGTADNQDVANVRVFVDSGASGTPRRTPRATFPDGSIGVHIGVGRLPIIEQLRARATSTRRR